MAKIKTKNLRLSTTARRRAGRLLSVGLIILAAAAGVYYVAGVNDLAVKGFKLYELKDRLAALEKDNEKLELATMKLESYAVVSERAHGLGLVKALEVEYLSPVGGIVAKVGGTGVPGR